MHPVSQLWLDSIGTWRSVTCKAVHLDPFTGKSTVLPIRDGSVTVDGSAAVRRTLALSVPPLTQYADALAAPGGQITVTQTVRYINRATETIPLGVFICDEDALDYDRKGNLTATGRDRMVTVQRADLADATSQAANPSWAEVKRLVEGAWPNPAYPFPGWAQLDTTATTPVGPLLQTDGDRGAAIGKILTSASLQLMFAPDGRAVLRRTPLATPASVPVWTVATGPGGAARDARRARDRSQLFNTVKAQSTAAGLWLTPETEANTNPADPYSVHGPLGARVKTITSPTFYTAAQMKTAAVVTLARLIGQQSDLSLDVLPNGALDADDVIGVRLPGMDPDGPPELRVIDSLTVPLLPTGTQQITCRNLLPTGHEDYMADLGYPA